MRLWTLGLIFSLSCMPAFGLMAASAQDLKEGWAAAKYAQSGGAQKEAFADLSAKAAALQQDFPEDSAVLLWRGTILSSYASATGGRQALGMVSQARDLLEQVLAKAPETEEGLAYGVLGALYARVPAWPVSFRDTTKARQYLEKGLALYPQSPDLHYYYGDFLRANHAYEQAESELKLALDCHPSPGRRGEIELALSQIEAQR